MKQDNFHIKNCPNCSAVQNIVQYNQQMIQEQIKLIKTLHQDKLILINQYTELERKYSDIQQQLLLIKRTPKTLNQQQQTEAITDQTINTEIEQRSLRVTSKLNQNQNPTPVTKVSMIINKQNINEFIPLVMIRKDEQYFTRKRKNSFEEESQAPHWLKAMEHLTPHNCSSKFRQKTNTLIKKMVPHQLRHLIWSIAMENNMAITDELYFELLQRKNRGWVSEEVRNQIEKDICRSFSGRTQYEQKAGLRAQVSQVLELFHIYRPDISYIQGMTYPVIVLTLVVGKVKAFSLFSNLILSNRFFKRLFTFQPQFVLIVARTFDILLLEYCPDIAEKMIGQHIDSQVFLVEWFFTIFSRSLSFQATLKFWDQLVYFGQVTLFRLALSIFELIGPRLMQTNYQQTLGLIQGFAGFINQTKLSQLLKHHKLTWDKLNKTIQRVQKFMLEKASKQ